MKARHTSALRWYLLAAAGVVPFACSRGERSSGEVGNAAGQQGSAAGEKGSAAGNGGTTGGQGGARPTCTNPELDPVSGLVTCSEGYQHRPTAIGCELAGGAPGDPSAGGAAGVGLPRADGTHLCGDDPQECDAFELGYCEEGFGGSASVCRSGCLTDEDCGEGYLCLCHGPSPTGGECVPGDCRTNDDCADGYFCAFSSSGCGSSFDCQTARDECFGDKQCSESASESLCYPSEDGPRRCGAAVACGRPFLVEAQPRIAEVVPGSDWLSAEVERPNVAALTWSERQAHAATWVRMGQLEHASIAAFARFCLQLLSLGAPPSLIEECSRAMSDETAHAELCFQIASSYAGRAIGPGALDVEGSLGATTLSDVVDLVIAEGCFGETGAALQALEAAETASDPAIARAYQRIARDEQRHAELAFRFVRWALERDREMVAGRIAAACESSEWVRHPARNVTVPCLETLCGLAPKALVRQNHA